MTNSKQFIRAALICAGLFSGVSAFAQDEVGGLVKSSPQDAMKLANAYLNPLFKGFGIGLNSGWNNTGRAKNTGRFELRVGFTGAFVPQIDHSFDVTNIGLSTYTYNGQAMQRVRPVNPNEKITPTVAGSGTPGPLVALYTDDNREIERFRLPQGSNLPFIPAPQLQATLGLPKGIDVTLRAMPTVEIGEYGSMGMIGGGVKLDVLPLLSKTADRIMPVDLGIAVGYTQFNYKLPLNVENASGSPNDPNQRIESKFSGINIETILSKKLMFFTPFISVGYNAAESDVRLKGKYEIITGATVIGPVVQPNYDTLEDPVTIKNNEIAGLRANAGFQLNLAVLRLYASYSVAEYNSFNAGLGIGLGK